MNNVSFTTTLRLTLGQVPPSGRTSLRPDSGTTVDLGISGVNILFSMVLAFTIQTLPVAHDQ